jgi:hypothetical protein
MGYRVASTVTKRGRQRLSPLIHSPSYGAHDDGEEQARLPVQEGRFGQLLDQAPSPAGRVERSLGTSDRREAEILAGPMITERKRALLAARPICKRFANSNPASTRVLTAVKIVSNEHELIYLNHNGGVPTD